LFETGTSISVLIQTLEKVRVCKKFSPLIVSVETCTQALASVSSVSIYNVIPFTLNKVEKKISIHPTASNKMLL
jgi:hypothetical protein